MSSLSSQVLEAWTSALGLQFQAPASSPMSSGMLSASGSSVPGSPTDCSTTRRSSTTCEPSRLPTGPSESTSCAVAGPASPSASRESARGEATNDTCGPRSRALWGYVDRATSSVRTCQGSFLSDWENASPTLPRSGSMLSGLLYARPTSERPIGESESSSWPTPAAQDTGRSDVSSRNRIAAGHQADLSTVVGLWVTPTSDDTGARQKKYAQGGQALSYQVNLWPTPTTRDYKDGPAQGDALTNALLVRAAPRSSLLVLPIRRDGEPSSNAGPTSPPLSKRRLNPLFVEWLMRLPHGWTDLKPLVMPSCHSRPRQLSASSWDGSANE